MANTYQIIDEKTWKRAMHCMVFRNSVEPVCKNGRIIMPVSVQAHHSFVDGNQSENLWMHYRDIWIVFKCLEKKSNLRQVLQILMGGIKMKCPYCDREMEAGYIVSDALLL